MFKIFDLDSNFEETINKFIKEGKEIIKWEFIPVEKIIMMKILVEYK